MLEDDRRQKSDSIKGQLKCLFSRKSTVGPGSKEWNWRPKSADCRGSGHIEEQRVMCILHSLNLIGRRSQSSISLAQLYVKPLPDYLQAKLQEKPMPRIQQDMRLKRPHTQATPQANKAQSNNEKIQLPAPQPLQTSKWHQKMLNKLENGPNAERVSSPIETRPAPPLNRQLQVQGQQSNCCTRQPSAISRYKPTISRAPRPPTFTFADPLPDDVPAICNKEGGLSLFEQRIIQLEKMERESIYLEKQVKPRVSKNESTTKIPLSLMQPKYLDSTLAFQSKVGQNGHVKTSPRKQSLTQVVPKSRSQTPSNYKTKENDFNKRYGKVSNGTRTVTEKTSKCFKPPKAAVTESVQIRRRNSKRPSSTKVS